MNLRSSLFAAAAIFLSLLPSSAQIRGFSQQRLDDWEFSKDGKTFQKVNLPHCCNASEGNPDSYYRGDSFYRTEFEVKDTQVDHYLYFEGAAQSCKVRVNGVVLANHKGGYTPFPVKINESMVEGINKVEVICNNGENLSMAPVSSDFNRNGGLHGQVWLLKMEDLYLSPEEYGQYRLRVETPEVGPNKVTTNVRAKICNPSRTETKIMVRVQLLEPDGVLAYQADRELYVKAYSEYEFSHDFFLTGLHFWDGVKDPYLYTVRIELFKGKRMLDIADTKIGYRYFELDPRQGFLLNGKPYPLRGVSLYQDMEGKALAMDASDFRADYSTVRELGANFVRLASYPHNDLAYQLCDSLGLVVQTEIPWVNVCGVNARQNYFNNIQQQMTEMVSSLYNHPSIVFWGMWSGLDEWANSSSFQGELDTEKVVEQTGVLYEIVKEMDPVRLVGFSDDTELGLPGYPQLQADYCSQNLSYGWNKTPREFGGFREALDRVGRKWAGPVAVSEYAAGINPFCHTWNHKDLKRDPSDEARHFEEYGNLLHEAHAAQVAAMPWLGFTAVGPLFDYPVAGLREGFEDSSDGEHFTVDENRWNMSDKGLVTRDRQTRKDVFYLYKSMWNKDETTVYITGRRLLRHPRGKEFSIKVYSNARGLTLYHNGRQVSKKTSPDDPTGVVWTFSGLKLKEDTDVFRVVASDGTSDEISLSRL